jgi:hypothetical protein
MSYGRKGALFVIFGCLLRSTLKYTLPINDGKRSCKASYNRFSFSLLRQLNMNENKTLNSFIRELPLLLPLPLLQQPFRRDEERRFRK